MSLCTTNLVNFIKIVLPLYDMDIMIYENGIRIIFNISVGLSIFQNPLNRVSSLSYTVHSIYSFVHVNKNKNESLFTF